MIMSRHFEFDIEHIFHEEHFMDDFVYNKITQMSS